MEVNRSELAAAVAQLQQGDGKAFEKIYNMTRESAYFTALKISKNEDDAEDILQDAYVYMLEKIGTLESPEAFKSWFNQIVANKAKDLLRKNHPERFTEIYFKDKDGEEQNKIDFVEEDDEEFIPEASIENTELCTAVMKMIESLSDDKRTAVILYYYNNMTTKEIAESLGVNENTVKSRLVQAKKDLSKSVTEYEKKHGKLLGVAPMPVVIWALKAAAASAASSSVASGAAATTLAAVTAGTAVAGTAAAGTGAAVGGGIAAKVIAGIIAAAIVGGGAIAGTKAVQKSREKGSTDNSSSSAVIQDSDEQNSSTDSSENSATALPVDKAVDVVAEKGELKYGVSYRSENYVRRDKDGNLIVEKGKIVPNYAQFSASYDDLLPAAKENSAKYSQDTAAVLSAVDSVRSSSGKGSLKVNSKLSEQAGVRAEEIAFSAKNSDTRPDGSSYTSVFDRNGFTSGSRLECRVYGQKTAADAVKVFKSKHAAALSNSDITDIGIGVSKTPDNDEFVFVIHLYSSNGNAENSSGVSDKVKNALVDKGKNDIDTLQSAQDANDELYEKTQDIPVLKDIFNYDFHNDWIFDGANDILDRIEGREEETEIVSEKND